MPEKQNIDARVDEKIDDKIAEAQIPERLESASASLNTAENIASQTTAEQDLRTAGQRQINLIWETTQRHIALFVVFVGCMVSATVVISGIVMQTASAGGQDSITIAAFTLLSNICFLVAGFYFGRTNHARIGDEPRKPGMDDR